MLPTVALDELHQRALRLQLHEAGPRIRCSDRGQHLDRRCGHGSVRTRHQPPLRAFAAHIAIFVPPIATVRTWIVAGEEVEASEEAALDKGGEKGPQSADAESGGNIGQNAQRWVQRVHEACRAPCGPSEEMCVSSNRRWCAIP